MRSRDDLKSARNYPFAAHALEPVHNKGHDGYNRCNRNNSSDGHQHVQVANDLKGHSLNSISRFWLISDHKTLGRRP